MIATEIVSIYILVCGFLGIAVSLFFNSSTNLIKLKGAFPPPVVNDNLDAATRKKKNERYARRVTKNMQIISEAIIDGARAFLVAEYKYMGVFIVLFSLILLGFLGYAGHGVDCAIFSVLSFVVGSTSSIAAGWIGMMIAVQANARVAVKAQEGNGWGPSFTTAFKAGAVMGFSLVAVGIINLWILVRVCNMYFTEAYVDQEQTKYMYECIAGFGLGGSSIALFGRVGGGIYTKAADVGADLCKISQGMDEDSPQNPAVIADNVGDNVGDIAGMGADLFGSFAESSCACMVIAASSPQLYQHWAAMCLPMVIVGSGVVVCLLTSFYATHINVVSKKDEVETSLKHQLLISTALMTPVVYFISIYFLPPTFDIGTHKDIQNWHVFFCIGSGLWSGLVIGYVTEYYTSHSYNPVRELAASCESGAATNIIYGLALGYKSVIIPIFCLAGTIYVSYSFAGMFGIANAALGILSTMAIGLTIDAYGPICDNAGGIAEMAHMDKSIREITDALDAAGNTTAAIGKGFAIGSAALVSLALFGGFVTIVRMTTVDILQPFQFAGLLVGAMLPYWFSAMTMKSVGLAAVAMVKEVNRQFAADPQLLKCVSIHDVVNRDLQEYLLDVEPCKQKQADDYKAPQTEWDLCVDAQGNNDLLCKSDRKLYNEHKPDHSKCWVGDKGCIECRQWVESPPSPNYNKCIEISTDSSLRQMLAPGALVMLTPIIVGFLFGVEALAGLLAGSLVSGVQMAISMSNTGGAWDNAKKYIESDMLHSSVDGRILGKKTPTHCAAVTGDTVGDPLKDTSGPALNILVKLSAIISLVFAPSFPALADGGLLVQLAGHGHTSL